MKSKETNLSARKVLIRALCLVAVALAVGLGNLVGTTHELAAQSPKPVRASDSRDEFILGKQIPVNLYNPNEALQWGIDFVISPSSAKDRVVLYAYDLKDADAVFFQRLESLVLNNQPLLAIVSRAIAARTNSETNNQRSSDYAVPIILDPRRKEFVGSFISVLADPNKAEKIVPAVIAVAALKAHGIGWEHLPPASSEGAWSYFIASSIPVSDQPKAVTYIGLRSGWNIVHETPGAMATQSELQRLITKYNF